MRMAPSAGWSRGRPGRRSFESMLKGVGRERPDDWMGEIGRGRQRLVAVRGVANSYASTSTVRPDRFACRRES
jgi:hypothetical protein